MSRPSPLSSARRRDGLSVSLRPPGSRYGEVYFPFQIACVLSEPGEDYEGGEFVLLEQRPRAQSRAHVVTPPRGAFVIFPTQVRPNAGKRGHHRVAMRHGVSTVTSGQRTAMGIIFHDAH